MKRIHRLASALAFAIAVWAALLSAELEPTQHTLVLLAPVLAVLAFGGYCFIALVYGVLTFRSWPEEAQLLKKEVEVAKADLAKRGIVVRALDGGQ